MRGTYRCIRGLSQISREERLELAHYLDSLSYLLKSPLNELQSGEKLGAVTSDSRHLINFADVEVPRNQRLAFLKTSSQKLKEAPGIFLHLCLREFNLKT